MAKERATKISLDRPVVYEIRVPGVLGPGWQERAAGMTIAVEDESGSDPVTVFTGSVDQAALQGLLRRLYALGLPIISVNRLVSERIKNHNKFDGQ